MHAVSMGIATTGDMQILAAILYTFLLTQHVSTQTNLAVLSNQGAVFLVHEVQGLAHPGVFDRGDCPTKVV